MPTPAVDPNALRDEVGQQLRDLVAEVEFVHAAIKGPGAPQLQSNFSLTVHAYLMAGMSYVDLLSQMAAGTTGDQTPRMESFLTQHFNASTDAATVAVKMWRHTLMHTSVPRHLTVDGRPSETLRWLLDWQVESDGHVFNFEKDGSDSYKLSAGLLLLLERLARVGNDVLKGTQPLSDAHIQAWYADWAKGYGSVKLSSSGP